jgi:hypothetical protein
MSEFTPTDECRIELLRHELVLEREAERRAGQDKVAWRRANGFGVGADVERQAVILAAVAEKIKAERWWKPSTWYDG